MPRTTGELFLRWDPRPGDGLSYAWAFPTAQGYVNIGYGTFAGDVTRAELLDRAARLLPAFDVAGTRMSGHLLPLSSRRPVPAVGAVLLVGDAASLVNPLSGEGIFYALASGALAGSAAARDPASAADRYRSALDGRFRRHLRQVRVLSALVDRPGVTETTIRACAGDERILAAVLAIGLGDGRLRVVDLLRCAVAAGRSPGAPR